MAEGGITVALVSAGIVCLIAAVIGGGLKGLGFDMPALQSVRRQVLLAGLGVALLAVGLVVRADDGAARSEAKPADATPGPAPAATQPPAAAPAVQDDAGPAAAWRSGPSAPPLREAQALLEKLGYYSGPVDGVPGPRTAEAIRRFQSDRHLPADGVAGPATLAAMRAAGR